MLKAAGPQLLNVWKTWVELLSKCCAGMGAITGSGSGVGAVVRSGLEMGTLVGSGLETGVVCDWESGS